MSPVLDDAEIRESLFPFSVMLYHEMGRLGMIPENVELLDGFVVNKMSRSPLHTSTVRTLAEWIGIILPADHFLMKDGPLTLAKSEPEPDLAVVAGDYEDYRHHHPESALLVMEVAINTLKKDRSKAAIYAAAGVGEYWLIEPEGRQITLFRMPDGPRYREAITYAGETTVTSQVLAGFSVDLTELFQN